MTKPALKFAMKETPARLKLAGLIDERNVREEKLRSVAATNATEERGQIARQLRDIENAIRLAVLDVIIDETQSAVSDLDAASKAFVDRLGAAIKMVDDIANVTKASGCGHHALQAVYASRDELNKQVNKIGSKLIEEMNLVAARAAVLKWSGTSSGSPESGLSALAEALLTNPMATLEA